MKLKCDLIIQNLNNPLSGNSNSQEKMHKAALIGLYRPKQEEAEEEAANCRSNPSAKSTIILTIETKNLNLKYKIKRIETSTRFIAEGKATLKLIDENIFLLISNTVALTLSNFISFLNIKISKSTLCNPKAPAAAASNQKTFVNKLLNNAQFSLGKNQLNAISPLTEKEVSDVLKARQLKQAGTPVRATNNFVHPSSTQSKSSTLRRSISGLIESESNNKPVVSTDSLKRSASSAKLAVAEETNKLSRSSSSSLLIDLTDEQKQVLKSVRDGHSVFFTGSGGSGKSFLISVIKKVLPHDNTFVTGSTGVAASLIGGITLHAFAGVSASAAEPDDNQGAGADLIDNQKLKSIVANIMNNKDKLNNWKKCKHLIIDEISMIDAYFFDLLEAIARSVKNNDKPFGGVQLILSGDFLQLPPVSRYGKPKKKFCFQANSWSSSVQSTMLLTKIKRQSDTVFIDLLEEIRFGKCSETTRQLLEKSKSTIFTDADILPTKLCTHKDDTELINSKELDSIEQESFKFKAIDAGDGPYKILNKLCPAKEELVLKVNSQVILLKNLDLLNNLVNGSRGCVVGFTDNKLPIVKFLNGNKITIKYDSWSFKVNAAGALATRKQIPLQLAWAISIHKSQGMTLDSCELSLSRVFEFGQAYVALSRCKSLQNLRILDFDVNAIKADQVVIKYYAKIARQNKGN